MSTVESNVKEKVVRVIDVRTISPRDRHPAIFGTLEALHPGECFEVYSDHEPAPLVTHIQHEYEGAVTFTFIERGPEQWHFRIARPA